MILRIKCWIFKRNFNTYKVNKKLLLFLFFINYFFLFAQKESTNWYFGNGAGLNFNSETPTPLLDGELITNEGCATISDPNGNLLFYTDGVTVWDRIHNIMPNGQSLKGHSSSTESSLIIPKPGSQSRFYIFTIDQPSYYLKDNNTIEGLNYTEIDLSLNSGYGDVVEGMKNIHLITYDENDSFENKYKSTEKITAVTHSDGSSIWVTTYFMNKFYSFMVDDAGVDPSPKISAVSQLVSPILNDEGANITAIGYIKISPNGKKIAIAHSSTSAGSPRSGTKKSGKVLIYDFNNITGLVSGQEEVLSNAYPYGLEFSPNSKLLYVTNSIFDDDDVFVNCELLQYNTESSNISNTKSIVSSSQNIAGALQLGIDGKIYRAGYKVFSKGLSLSVINKPNEIGSLCNYSENSLSLAGGEAKLGLPPFIQSLFLYSFDYEYTCFGDNTHFFITSDDLYDSVLWDFGDGQSSTDDEVYHVYDFPGVYLVSLKMTLNGVEREPLIKEIIISEMPEVMNGVYDLIQCDSFDGEPYDNITTFNLQLANDAICLNNNDDVQVFYYHSILEAESDTLNVNTIDNIYRNEYIDELVYAKVLKTNTECYSIVNIRLKTTEPFDIGHYNLIGCDLENSNSGYFDLSEKRYEISLDLNLHSYEQITFHESEYEAVMGLNSLYGIYSSSEATLYIRVESENTCYGFGILNLSLNSFPQIDNQIFNVCSVDFPLLINSGIPDNLISNYFYKWSTNESSNEILVNEPGVYEVLVYNEASNCEVAVNITVVENEVPEIIGFDIDDHNVVVNVNSENNFLFSIDNIYGIYQESNIFLNIPSGIHEVFVKDLNSCEIISKTFNVIGFPKFFTPNNDGVNDNWNVYGLEEGQLNIDQLLVSIYDRYGNFIISFNPINSIGWNGNYLGTQLNADDYWYNMKLSDSEVYRGHFSLKR